MARRWFARSVVSVVSVALLLVPAGSAMAGERNWRVRLMGALAGDNGGVVGTSAGYSGAGVSIGGGAGAGVNFEHRYSPKMGFEMGAMAIGARIQVGVLEDWPHHKVGVEVGSYLPLTFGLNYHPLKNTGGFDLFLGPLIASVIQSRVGVGVPVGVEARMDFGLGVNLGADINLGKSRWSLNTGFKYISILTNSGSRESRAVFDPLIFTFGFGFRF